MEKVILLTFDVYAVLHAFILVALLFTEFFLLCFKKWAASVRKKLILICRYLDLEERSRTRSLYGIINKPEDAALIFGIRAR
jgi:hypothetical protein